MNGRFAWDCLPSDEVTVIPMKVAPTAWPASAGFAQISQWLITMRETGVWHNHNTLKEYEVLWIVAHNHYLIGA